MSRAASSRNSVPTLAGGDPRRGFCEWVLFFVDHAGDPFRLCYVVLFANLGQFLVNERDFGFRQCTIERMRLLSEAN